LGSAGSWVVVTFIRCANKLFVISDKYFSGGDDLMASLPCRDSEHQDLKEDVVTEDFTMKDVVTELVSGYLSGDYEVDL